MTGFYTVLGGVPIRSNEAAVDEARNGNEKIGSAPPEDIGAKLVRH